MKLSLFTLLALCLIAGCKSAEEEYDYEDEQAAPVTPAPTRSPPGRLGGLLSSRARPNVGRKPAQTTQATTAKPVEQPPAEEEEGEEAYDENQEQEEAPTTTTESTKKIRGGVRPFRSNQDLLAALKRRRAQVGPSSHSKESHATTETTTPKSKSTTSSRNKSTSSTEPRTSGRSGRFGATRGKAVQEEVEETQREEVQVKAKPYRRG